MLMFTLAISCLITSNLPWFMDLTFQVPVQYSSNSIRFYFHQLIEHRFCIGPAASFFLGLLGAVLHSSPVAYWTPYDLGVSCFGVISSLLSIQFIRFSQQVYWGGLPFPPPEDHVLSELFAIICLGLPCMAWLIASLSYTSPFTTTRQWYMKRYDSDVCCHPVCLTYILMTSWEMPGGMSCKLESI